MNRSPKELLESGMEQTNEILALRRQLAEGKRLLAEAIRQRNEARGELSEVRAHHRYYMNALKNAWAFKLLPKHVKSWLRGG